MSCDDITEPIKSSVWLGFQSFIVPLDVLTSPPVIGSVKESLKFSFLEDEFEIFVLKVVDSVLNVAVYRNRQNPNERPDDGYALRFYFTLIGFDEDPQTAVMKHDEQRSNPPVQFKVTESILAKVNITHHVFELFVVIHMLEFKSLNKRNEKKKKVDAYMAFLKRKLTQQGKEDLGFILKSPGINDTFTARLPESYMSAIFLVIASMARNFGCIARYLSARENSQPQNLNLALRGVLKYLGLATHRGPVSSEQAVEQYFIAHKLGLEGFKTIASDYLLSILEKDYAVLDVLYASLLVHDKDLFDKAIISFMNRFHEITRSEKFQYYTREKGIIARLMIHSARIWVTNNDVYIPTWVPTTEL